MARKPSIDEAEIGRALLIARDRDDTDWKVLVERYGLRRTRLWMLYRAAKKNVHEHFGGTTDGQAGALVDSKTA